MLGHREPLKTGEEWDVVYARKFIKFSRGQTKKVKTGMNRRFRRLIKILLHKGELDGR